MYQRSALLQEMEWRRLGATPFLEAVMSEDVAGDLS